MPLQESLKVTFDELGDIDILVGHAEKLVCSDSGSSILVVRDDIERLKANIQELSLLSDKAEDALKDVQQLWHKLGTLVVKSPGPLSAELTDFFQYDSCFSPK